MPVSVRKQSRRRKRGKKSTRYRVVEAATGRIARNKAGTAIDGGGHSTESKARSQARAVNAK